MPSKNICNCQKCQFSRLLLKATIEIIEKHGFSVPEAVDGMAVFCGLFMKEQALPGHEMAVFTHASQILAKILLVPDQSIDRSAMH